MTSRRWLLFPLLFTASCVGLVESEGERHQQSGAGGSSGATGSTSSVGAAGNGVGQGGGPSATAGTTGSTGGGGPGLTWAPTIAATAQGYAAKWVFKHSGTAGVGENLAAYAPRGGHTASSPVDDWASEKANYDYTNNTCASGQVCGHYTQ